MRIILLTQIVPNPPDSGPRIKTHNVLRYLAQRHDIHLVSFVRSDTEVACARALGAYCRAGVTTVPIRRSRWHDVGYLVRSLITGRPFLVERDDSHDMRRVLAELVAASHFDAIHADQLSMAQFVEGLPVEIRVLDEHNAVWTIVRRAAMHETWFRRLPAELEWRKLKAYEGKLCRQFDQVTIVSEDDRRHLEQASGASFASTLVPIAIDTQELAFEPRGAKAKDVLSVATMFYPPNVEGILWFADRALPQIREDTANTRFLIVGSRPPREVIELATDPGRGCTVTGYVTDLSPLLHTSAVLVVPLHSGSGMRVKILEAFARGIPVVSTSVGVEGIDAEDGVHLLIADEPLDFAGAVTRLLRDAELSHRLAIAGRRLVEEKYDWRTALTALDQVYPDPIHVAGLATSPAGEAVIVNILFVAPYVPSPIRVRPYHFVRQLSQRHRVVVLAVGSEPDDRAALAELRAWGVDVYLVPMRARYALTSCARAVLGGAPLQAAVCQSAELRHRLGGLLSRQSVDIVHIEHLRAANLHECVPRHIPRVYDSVDCISLLLARTLGSSHSLKQRLIAAVELHRTRRFEGRLLSKFDATVVTSSEDAGALESLTSKRRVDVIPNGVDLDVFQPYVGRIDPATLVFSGKMSYHANASAVLHFAENILPLVRATHPHVRLRVVGSNPPQAVKRLEGDPMITVTGHVPDMRRALGGATVAISPMTVKVGIQNKVLEAMALGLPVVTSRLGAQGLAAIPEHDLLVAENAAAFAQQIARLLDDQALRGQLAAAGRHYVETQHRWDAAARQLEAVYERVARSATVSQPNVDSDAVPSPPAVS